MSEPERQFDLTVSVIIPAYRRPEMLRQAVESLLRQDLDPALYEVIVVDSSPDDRNVATVRELQPSARCHLQGCSKPPEGPGPSRNLGARMARGRILAFMDSDCQASPQWLREGVAAFEDKVGLVQGRTLADPSVPHGVFNYYITVEEESYLYEAANIFYRREAFEPAGGFLSDLTPNAETPMGGEDTDLAWKVKQSGWQSRFAREAVVFHEVVRIPPWRWIVNKRLFIYPLLLKKFPHLRSFVCARYFFDRIQAWLVLGLIGTVMAWWSLFGLVLWGPYVVARASEKSRTLRGPLRLLRVLIYLPRDAVSLGLLLAGSIRYRCLLL